MPVDKSIIERNDYRRRCAQCGNKGGYSLKEANLTHGVDLVASDAIVKVCHVCGFISLYSSERFKNR